ncbi:MAG: uncharacterized protein QOD86_308 [Miltoncostaeaceae bacterium]|nr:uncharacterized protein [Miltoncostaeaceae bacterium]
MGRLRVDRLAGPPAELVTGAGELVAARCYRAGSAVGRRVGVLGAPHRAPDEALWLEPCASVHGLGLRARIGCAFLADDGTVLRVVDPLPRGGMAAARGAHAVVECAAGRLAALPAGTRLALRSSPAVSRT